MKNKPRKIHLVLLNDAPLEVIRLIADQNYTVFYMQEGKTQIMSYTLKNYQNHFHFPFVRVNKSCIVNLLYFKNISIADKKIQLKDGFETQVSRRRMKEVLKEISYKTIY